MYLIVLSNVVAADTLLGNGVGGRMAIAPHYNILHKTLLQELPKHVHATNIES